MNKDWTGNSSLYLTNHRKKDVDVAEHDLYCTHPDSVKIFLQKCKDVGITLPRKIWEPAAGLNSIVDVLVENGYDVLATDLVDRGCNKGGVDFLQLSLNNLPSEFQLYHECILTNPPYSMAKEFVEKALDLVSDSGWVIMFLKLTFLEGKKRQELFHNKHLKYVWVYTQRQGCGKNIKEFENGGAAASYAMFLWKKDYVGLPQIDWL